MFARFKTTRLKNMKIALLRDLFLRRDGKKTIQSSIGIRRTILRRNKRKRFLGFAQRSEGEPNFKSSVR